ncbi:MAG TPA: glycerol-3-phosphate 1-O-acyltransferase PlsY [Candidatus Angelobacter sp.]|jgi:glycerol-3-phosphate acyltransferase PlsY|nr:glycerol-3-phosphate 1-O-acyltransferase PlsY [Candidatus Angelobacter sp.]
MLVLFIVVAGIGYLLGAIPFGFLLVKVFRGEDIRLSGSGNIGATNVARSGAKGLGLATLILDAFKGFLAVWVASILGSSAYNSCDLEVPCVPATRLMAAAALAAVLGHIFPVWLRFRGGKGVAVAVGAFGLLFPKALLVTLVLFVVVVALTRYVSLGSILGAITFPVAAYFVEHAKLPSVLLVSAIGALIVLKHSQNIRRLLAGNENRFGVKREHA